MKKTKFKFQQSVDSMCLFKTFTFSQLLMYVVQYCAGVKGYQVVCFHENTDLFEQILVV